MKYRAESSFHALGLELGSSLGGRNLIESDRNEQFDGSAWKIIGKSGILGLGVSDQYGGREASFAQTVELLRGLGHNCRDNGLLFAMGAHIWACIRPIEAFGSDEQKKRYLPNLCSGQMIASHAATEPTAGSDILGISTTAKPTAGGFVLNGRKSFVTNGPLAGLFVVLGKISGDGRLTAFLVPGDSVGVICSPNVSKMGMRTAQMCAIEFVDCEISADCVLGGEGDGMAVFMHAMELERLFILACSIGTMEWLLAQAIAYSNSRRQFGTRIAAFQRIRDKIADVSRRITIAKALLDGFARGKDAGKLMYAEASIAKLQLSESWIETCLDVMQIFGGQGYLVETELERELRDALASRIYSGTSDLQKETIATFLGLAADDRLSKVPE